MRLHGKGGLILLGLLPGDAASPVVYMSSWSISFAPELGPEITVIGNPGRCYVAGAVDVSGDFTGWFDDASWQIYRQARDGQPRPMYLYPAAAQRNRYFAGMVNADFSVNGSIDGAVAVKSTWKAAGEVAEEFTDFIISASASIAGAGQASVVRFNITSAIVGVGVALATPTIRAPVVPLVAAGIAGAIPRTAILAGAGAVATVQPVISVTAALAAAGGIAVRPVISVTSSSIPDPFGGQGQISVPGPLRGVAAGSGSTGDGALQPLTVPIIGVKAALAGAGAATSGHTDAIGAGSHLAGAGGAGVIPILSASRNLAGAGIAGAGGTVSGTSLAYRGTPTTGFIHSATTITLNKPAGVVSGDLMVIYASGSSAVSTGPSGFTLQQSSSNTGTGFWSKIAGGSEPSSYTIVYTTNLWVVACLVAFSGQGTTWQDPSTFPAIYDPVSSSTTCPVPSITLAGSSDWLIGFFCFGQNVAPGTISLPGGFTQQVAQFNSGTTSLDSGMIVGDVQSIGSGATGTQTATTTGTVNYPTGYILGIRGV